MNLFARNPAKPAARTLRALARLVRYPDADLRDALPLLRDALHAEAALAPARLDELDALIRSIERSAALEAEADYVQLFDSGRRTSLYLFEHVHGDSRDRGPAMIALAQSYEKAGLYLATGEMPDFLPVALEYASTQPPVEAQRFLQEMSAILLVIFAALTERQSRYASVLGALLDLAGEPARAVTLPAEEALDEAWAEPAAFDGCSTRGQASPSAPQPIHIVRRESAGKRVAP